MKTIGKSDIIFATIYQRGRKVASIDISGVVSLNEIMKRLRGFLSRCVGMATLQLRNSSQGWVEQHSIMVKATEAVQLSLF